MQLNHFIRTIFLLTIWLCLKFYRFWNDFSRPFHGSFFLFNLIFSLFQIIFQRQSYVQRSNELNILNILMAFLFFDFFRQSIMLPGSNLILNEHNFLFLLKLLILDQFNVLYIYPLHLNIIRLNFPLISNKKFNRNPKKIKNLMTFRYFIGY